jgi:hypothetical protein
MFTVSLMQKTYEEQLADLVDKHLQLPPLPDRIYPRTAKR